MIPKILIAEDQEEIRTSIGNFLGKRINCEILYTGSGIETVGIIEQNSLDLLFLDLKLPGKSGLEILANIRKRGKTLPVIVISGFDSSEISEQVMNLDAFFMPKPISLKVIFDKTKEILEKEGKFKEKVEI